MLIFAERKKIRAKVIKRYIEEAEYKGVVCFSCGNASRALNEAGINTLDISPQGDLRATKKWWTPQEIHRIWPDLFDATSGHLPLALMVKISEEYRKYLGKLDKSIYEVLTGSGETIICLSIAYPSKKFIAVYDNKNNATKYESKAPLNSVVKTYYMIIKR